MRVLGISPLDKDSTASFLEDGRVVFACAEERLSRVKLDDGFPHRAVQLGLARTGWKPDSIDAVAYGFYDGDEEARRIRDMRRACPAAVHVDGTARPQLVSERTNPSFHRILRGYHELTGIPALINTSFNMHEEPIVCTPADAVRAFLQGRLDYLAIGPYLVPHPRLSEIAQERESLAAR